MTDPRVRFLLGNSEDDVVEVLRLLDEPTIRISAASMDEWRHQVLLYAVVDLLGRIFPRLDVAVDLETPAAPSLPPGGSTVDARLLEVRQRSPLKPLSPGDPAFLLHIGSGDVGADLYIDAKEWQSYLGRKPSRLSGSRSDTAIGPLVAACRAGAQVYSTLLAPLREPFPVPDEIYASALTYRMSSDPLEEPEPTSVNVLNALLVGGGSVGGAAAYAVHYEPHVAGRLTVCDPEILDETNPYRAILATASAAGLSAYKADEIAAALIHHRELEVSAERRTITDWEAAQSEPPVLPLVLVAVDRRESRELIQDALPLDLINAAVGADLVAVSGHRTGSGPCMCCLHMPAVLDEKSIKNRLIAEATGLQQQQVNEFRVGSVPLEEQVLRHIERHRQLVSGALAPYTGKTLDELYNSELLYGESEVRTAGGSKLAVASPFVTAMAGVLLAAEALKRGTPALSSYVLGSGGVGIQYRENPYAPEHGFVDRHITRASICLCRSFRRMRLLADLHGLPVESLDR